MAKALRIAKAANIAKFSHHPASYLLSLRLFPRLLSPASDFCSQREVFPVYIMLPSSSRQPTLLSFPSPRKRLIRFPRIQIRNAPEKTAAVLELSTWKLRCNLASFPPQYLPATHIGRWLFLNRTGLIKCETFLPRVHNIRYNLYCCDKFRNWSMLGVLNLPFMEHWLESLWSSSLICQLVIIVPYILNRISMKKFSRLFCCLKQFLYIFRPEYSLLRLRVCFE